MAYTENLTAAGVTTAMSLNNGQSMTYSADGTFTGFARLERSRNGGMSWETVTTGAADTAISGTIKNESGAQERYRFRAIDTDGETPLTGTVETSLADVDDTVLELRRTDGSPYLKVTDDGVIFPGTVEVQGAVSLDSSVTRTSRKVSINAAGQAKAGGTAGWVVANAGDTGLVTCPASQTASTLVVPVPSLNVGDTITAFYLTGQIESAGNTVTVDADLRKHTAAAADVSDASVGAIVQLSVVADTVMSSANTRKASLSEVVGDSETFYVLITATTDASTDIALQGLVIEITEA